MNVFHLPHGVPVLETVARHLLDQAGDDPTALSRALVFLPTRRAARALGAAFLRVGEGRPLLLPRMVAIGDIDANPLFMSLAEGLPPPIPPLIREAALAERIRTGLGTADITPDRALLLAADLARLLDEADEAGCDLARLKQLEPERFARHWQRTLAFLEVAAVWWREELRRRGCASPVQRRVAMLGRLPGWLARHAADAPVLALGIASPAPAQAALLAAIARLPRGAVLLPGLDTTMSAAAWAALAPSHPQAEYRAFLERIGLARAEVRGPWPAPSASAGPRALLLSRALLPAEALDWSARPEPSATAGLTLLVAPDSATEARAVALAVREALEAPEHRVAVITPDRAQAERIAAALARWHIVAVDSAAQPVARTAPGALLRLIAQAVARGLAPVPLLSLLRHPLVAGGMAPEAFRRAGRNFELAALRGVRPHPDLLFSPAVLPAGRGPEDAGGGWRKDAGILALQAAVARALEPLIALCRQDSAAPARLLRATVTAAEMLAATDAAAGAPRLWDGPEGAALARHVAACDAALAELGPIAPRWWPDLLDRLLAKAAVRLRSALAQSAHPRVEILGVLEARLLSFDVAILAGLNEGTWPAAPDPGPWLSREQRRTLGLASPDAEVGFAAADFVAACCSAPRVILCRAERVEGQPSVASRWITRLAALAGEAALRPGTDHVALAALLDRPAQRRPERRPAPAPPLAARPRDLWVTTVETLIRNPYAVYARDILGLRALDPLDQEADAADWGSLVHRVAAEFVRQWAAARPDDQAAHDLFLRTAETALIAENIRPGLQALWRPRLATLAPWFVRHMRETDAVRILTECTGRIELDAATTLAARADRIEVAPDGALRLIDYKTGRVPTQTEVRAGKAPQLTLTARIAAGGGFPGVPADRPVAALTYLKISGGPEPAEARPACRPDECAQAIAAAGAQLAALLAHHADPASAYPARRARDDYAHLSRVAGWSVAAADGEETEA